MIYTFSSLSSLSFLLLSFLSCLCQVEGKKYRGFNDVTEMPIAVSDMTATLIPESYFADKKGPRVFVIGGCSGNQLCPPTQFCYCTEVTDACNIFFIDSNTWESCVSAPRPRCRHASAFLNGKIFLFGGRDVSDTLIQDVDVLDTSTGQWIDSFSWTNASSDFGAFVDDTSIYLVGGYDANYAPLSTLTQYFPENKAWNSDLPSMAFPRGDLGAISVPINKDNSKGSVYSVVGGFASSICNPLAVVETFDPATETWTTRTPLSLGRADMALGVLQGLLFAVAGETKDSTCDDATYSPGVSIPVNDVERLESIDGDWVFEEDIPDNRFRFVATSSEKAIYLFGGQGQLINSDSGTPYYAVLNTTILYVPKSIADKKELDDGEIAGIVVGGVVFIGFVIFGVFCYFVYRKFHGYTAAADDEDPKQTEQIPDGNFEIVPNDP